MDNCKMDFEAGRNQNTPKATRVGMIAKGVKRRVFSSWRYSHGYNFADSYVYQYVKAWRYA
jgi:hypothetical protein